MSGVRTGCMNWNAKPTIAIIDNMIIVHTMTRRCRIGRKTGLLTPLGSSVCDFCISPVELAWSITSLILSSSEDVSPITLGAKGFGSKGWFTACLIALQTLFHAVSRFAFVID